jgi:hypothetical protein
LDGLDNQQETILTKLLISAKISKQVYLYSIENTLIKEFSSITAAVYG